MMESTIQVGGKAGIQDVKKKYFIGITQCKKGVKEQKVQLIYLKSLMEMKMPIR